MITDKETNAVYISALLRERFPELHDSISSVFIEEGVPLTELENTEDIWCRDYMPVQITADRFVLFKYNPDYLQPKKYQPLRSKQSNVISPLNLNLSCSDLIVDGGNIVRYQNKVILTDRIFKENKNTDKPEILEQILTILGVEKVIIVPHVPYDFTGHSDGMVRFINHDTVLLNDFHRYHPDYFEKLKKSLTRHGLNITLLPWDGWKNKTDKEDTGDYINFLHVGNLLIVPEYHSETDAMAKAVIQDAYPGARIKGVDCNKIALEGGLLNCCTWNIKTKLN